MRWQGLLVGVGALESNQIREILLKQNQNGEINLRDQTTDHNQLLVQRMPLFTSFLNEIFNRRREVLKHYGCF